MDLLPLRKITGCLLVLGALLRPIPAQQNFEDVQIEIVQVTKDIHMLRGPGGNIGVSSGKDAVFLIDDQYAPLTEKITQAVSRISSEPIRFLVNTHWHGDHTGGNENLGNAGVIIVAHENVRKRMSTEQFLEFFGNKVPPAPQAALPIVTFNDTATFYLNGEEIHIFHLPPAHTDGDSVIHFRNSNVIHTGDLFTYGQFPFIDIGAGGSVDGMIANADRLLELVDSDTKLLPGHGPLGGRSQLLEFRDMLATIRERIKTLMDAGRSLEEITRERPTREFDDKWGKLFLKPDDFVRLIFTSLASQL